MAFDELQVLLISLLSWHFLWDGLLYTPGHYMIVVLVGRFISVATSGPQESIASTSFVFLFSFLFDLL